MSLSTELAKSPSFYKRSLYIDACTMSFELYSRAFFRDYFAESLLGLCDDAVPNIRLRLCRMLPRVHRTLRPSDKALRVVLENCMHRLCTSEKDRDVISEWRTVQLPQEQRNKQQLLKGKRKEEYLYSAIYTMHSLKALRRGSHSFTCKLHHACLSFLSIRQMAPPLTEVADI